MEFDAERVWANVRQSSTEDLLDRVTVYREGMEPDAVEIVEAELRSRGIRNEQIEAHGRQRREMAIPLPDGTARRCSFCDAPAVVQNWGWHRLWRVVPVFPRKVAFCEAHRPAELADDDRPITP